ncbi:MAG: hypothetical protein U1E23_05860 [Reyranellaceae bacterium]
MVFPVVSRGLLAAAALLASGACFAQGADDRTATPSKGLLWGSKMTVEGEPCCAGAAKGKTGDKPDDKAEAAVLAGLGDRAARDGPILRLRLQGNRTLKITDCDDQDACEADRYRMHRLAGWWPKQGYYLIKVGLYEDGLGYLVSERDGRTTRVAAVPVLSPSGHRAVALQSNLMNGVTLDVVDLASEPPKVTAVETLPSCAGSTPNSLLRPRPVWSDDGHVRFEGTPPQPGDDPKTKQLLQIGAGAPQWQC